MKALIYLLQVSACTGLFYVFYFLLLRRLTFFTLNRWYLLVTLMVSFVVPTLTFEIYTAPEAQILQPVMYLQQMQDIHVQPTVLHTGLLIEQRFNWISLGIVIYFLVAMMFFARLILVLFHFRRKLSNNELIKVGGVKIFYGDKTVANSSFLNVVFIDDKDLSPEDLKQVIAHELLHIGLLHSLDRIVAWLVQIVLWFNPFVYAYMRSIEENHEFEVDRIAGENDRNLYASLLLKLSLSSQNYLLQGFSRAPLKKRVFMLFNQPTPNMKKLIYVLVLPVVLLSCLAFSKLKTNNPAATSKQVNIKNSGEYYMTDTTQQFRQKLKRTANELHSKEAWVAYSKTQEYMDKKAVLDAVFNKEQEFIVKSQIDTLIEGQVKIKGFIVTTNNYDFILDTRFGEDKRLCMLLQVGDKFDMKLHGAGFGIHSPISISAAYVKKNGVKIFQIAEASPIPKYPFLYEANKVRFADGQVTHIQTYATGKWKSADLEVVNGYKFHLKFKPDAPEFAGIEESDHVRFRFVDEVKTGAKDYAVSDWVSMTTDINDYGIKNPDFFYKFYEKI
jgi:hypothetical protein